MALVGKEHNENEIIPGDAKDKPFDPTSHQPITIEVDGIETTITFEAWLKMLNTNGRGGT